MTNETMKRNRNESVQKNDIFQHRVFIDELAEHTLVDPQCVHEEQIHGKQGDCTACTLPVCCEDFGDRCDLMEEQ